MIIALDYDKTYTADPKLWMDFIQSCKARGHKVICLTMRYPTEPITDMLCDVIYTSRKAKLVYAIKNGIAVDIWIDDSPAWLFDDAASA